MGFQVLPVFLKVLPLKEDHEESMAVYSCICNLVLSSNPQVLVSYVFVKMFWPFSFLILSHLIWLFPHLGAMQILSLVPELVNLFAQVAGSPVETPEVKALIGRAFSHLISLYGHQMQPLLANLSPALANALAAVAPKS